jgi:formiminotetrahydrofolate cyclodeaminase
VGALMAYSGVKGAALNVKINLKNILDNDFNAGKRDEIENIEKRAEVILKDILGKIQDSFSNSLTSSSS